MFPDTLLRESRMFHSKGFRIQITANLFIYQILYLLSPPSARPSPLNAPSAKSLG